YGRSPHYLNMALWGYVLETMNINGNNQEHLNDPKFLQVVSDTFKIAILSTVSIGNRSQGISRDTLFVLNRALDYSALQSIESKLQNRLDQELEHSNKEIHQDFDDKSTVLLMREEDLKHEIESTTPRLGAQLIFTGSLFTLGLIVTAFDQQTGVLTNFWRESVLYTFLPWATDAWGYWGRNALYGVIEAWQSLQNLVAPVTDPFTESVNKIVRMPSNQNSDFLHKAGVANSLLAATLFKTSGLIQGLASEIYLLKVKSELRSIPARRKLLERNRTGA